jgi:hypothetical protein
MIAHNLEDVPHVIALRRTYIEAPPYARLNVIRKRLQKDEIGPVALLTCVSAVEALARSVVIHWGTCELEDVHTRYMQWKRESPEALVQRVLSLAGLADPTQHFGCQLWELFQHAVLYRNLIVHECTLLGQDTYPQLIDASRNVLTEVARIGGLELNLAK